MFLSSHLWASSRRGASTKRHRCLIEVGLLEGRLLLVGPGDLTAPVTTAMLIGNQGLNGFFRSPVTVDLSANDADDAPNTLTTYSSVNGAPFVAGNAISLTADGTYNVAYFSQDPAGNFEPTHSLLVHIDQTAPTLTTTASPTTLFPPNHKFTPVTITGHVADNLSGVVSSVSFNVVDEYGQVQPAGTAAVDANGNYTFVVNLQSSRLGQDKDGRQYTINVTASDEAGNQTTADSTVTVLHDRGRHNGQGSGQSGAGVKRHPKTIAHKTKHAKGGHGNNGHAASHTTHIGTHQNHGHGNSGLGGGSHGKGHGHG